MVPHHWTLLTGSSWGMPASDPASTGGNTSQLYTPGLCNRESLNLICYWKLRSITMAFLCSLFLFGIMERKLFFCFMERTRTSNHWTFLVNFLSVMLYVNSKTWFCKFSDYLQIYLSSVHFLNHLRSANWNCTFWSGRQIICHRKPILIFLRFLINIYHTMSDSLKFPM